LKSLESINFDPEKCRRELASFRRLLDSSIELDERKHVLPLFRRCRHLSAAISKFHPLPASYNRLAYEFDLFGSFKCDLVAGDHKTSSFVLVEFEDGKRHSIFGRSRAGGAPAWSPRFEHGFSQLIDWFWKIEDARTTSDFRRRFGGDRPSFSALLVIGRDEFLDDQARDRIRWRTDQVTVNSARVTCLTYDQLFASLAAQFDLLSQIANRLRPRNER
jgi:hypothetical protein